MNRPFLWARFGLALTLLALPLGGCPVDNGPPDDNGDDTNGNLGPPVDTSIFTVVTTDIPVRHDASLRVGDDLIVFGTGANTGVAYVVPSTDPTAATAVPGDFRSSGFAVVDKKILLFDSAGQLSIFDTTTEELTPVAADVVTLITLPTNDDEDHLSPVVTHGALAITRNNANAVNDGFMLKVIDVSGEVPVVTPLQNPPVNPGQVAIDADDQRVVTFGGNRFFVYDLTQPAAAPSEIDLTLQGGIAGPFAYDYGHILYVADSFPLNVRLVNVTVGVSIPLTTVPAQRLLSLAIDGGWYAYFLDREAFDIFSVVFRSAIGRVPQTAARVGGVPGGDPDLHDPPFEGYGNDIAIESGGRWIFISGNGGINDRAEFLQVSEGGRFTPFAANGGFLTASDVDVNAELLAFKTGVGEATTLGYIILP